MYTKSVYLYNSIKGDRPSRILPKVRSGGKRRAIALWEEIGDRFRFHLHPEILRGL
ncbi:hypothetical protein QT970_30075 [Microcoleus sp. herbarium8]|uniref:hypothetical protein n=1 Tax=Microcoleus sp. herbarium8 TaxID=3055436 RepID=UPI002FD20C04